MPRSERHPIKVPADIVLIRKIARAAASEAGLGLVDQTKVVTAASELARNTLEYGGGGEVEIDLLFGDANGRGVRLTFIDKGPGIPDVAKALTDGFSTGKGLGMGLSGSKRLMSEFELETEVGKGTRVTVTKWK